MYLGKKVSATRQSVTATVTCQRLEPNTGILLSRDASDVCQWPDVSLY